MFRTNFIAILIFFLFTSQISTHFQKPHNKLENNAITVPIYSNYFELYSYFIYVQVGTPSVNFSVILDTGSSDFLIPAYNCVDCAGGLPKNKYNPAHSSTYTPISCTNSSFTCSTCVDENLCGFTMPYVGLLFFILPSFFFFFVNFLYIIFFLFTIIFDLKLKTLILYFYIIYLFTNFYFLTQKKKY